MMNLIGRRMSQVAGVAGADAVIAGFPLPAGGRLNQVNLEFHIIHGRTLISRALFYGITGFVVPVLDPDSAVTYDVLWDRLIPKDIGLASGVFDIDTTAIDASAEYEVGEVDWSQVFDLTSLAPVEIFRRRKMLTYATNPSGFDLTLEDYAPTDFFKTVINRRVSVKTPSIVMFGLSVPDVAEAAGGGIWSTLSENEWSQMQFLEMTLEESFKYLMGLIEAGAETPFIEAATLVEELLEGSIVEASAGRFTSTASNCFTRATFNVSVPGQLGKKTLTSE